MNMSIPKMNKNAVFIKNFTFREAEHIVPKEYHAPRTAQTL